MVYTQQFSCLRRSLFLVFLSSLTITPIMATENELALRVRESIWQAKDALRSQSQEQYKEPFFQASGDQALYEHNVAYSFLVASDERKGITPRQRATYAEQHIERMATVQKHAVHMSSVILSADEAVNSLAAALRVTAHRLTDFSLDAVMRMRQDAAKSQAFLWRINGLTPQLDTEDHDTCQRLVRAIAGARVIALVTHQFEGRDEEFFSKEWADFVREVFTGIDGNFLARSIDYIKGYDKKIREFLFFEDPKREAWTEFAQDVFIMGDVTRSINGVRERGKKILGRLFSEGPRQMIQDPRRVTNIFNISYFSKVQGYRQNEASFVCQTVLPEEIAAPNFTGKLSLTLVDVPVGAQGVTMEAVMLEELAAICTGGEVKRSPAPITAKILLKESSKLQSFKQRLSISRFTLGQKGEEIPILLIVLRHFGLLTFEATQFYPLVEALRTGFHPKTGTFVRQEINLMSIPVAKEENDEDKEKDKDFETGDSTPVPLQGRRSRAASA